MKCEDIKQQFALYFDDILPEELVRSMDEHLATCPLCRMEVSEFQQNRLILRSAARFSPDASLLSDIRAMVRGALIGSDFGPSLALIERRKGWFETWGMPSLVGSFATMILGFSMLWLILSPASSAERVFDRPVPAAETFVLNVDENAAYPVEITPAEFASSRLLVSADSPSINPQGALIALSSSLVRGEMKDQEVVIVASVFGDGLARIEQIVEPRQDESTISELRKAFASNTLNAPFVPASMDRRAESMRVVLKFQSVDVPLDLPGL